MKKEYITPAMILRRVCVERIMDGGSIGGDEGTFGGADARENDDWADDEESGNIWED